MLACAGASGQRHSREAASENLPGHRALRPNLDVFAPRPRYRRGVGAAADDAALGRSGVSALALSVGDPGFPIRIVDVIFRMPFEVKRWTDHGHWRNL
jgi:hypothetical protein